jgi:hypothetical protein
MDRGPGHVVAETAGPADAELPARSQDYVDDTGLAWRQVVRGTRPGDQFVRITPPPDFLRRGSGVVTLRPETLAPHTPTGHLRRLLFGKPIPTAAELLERVGIPRGLAIFPSDNISSSAYATEEIMRVLALAGVAALVHTLSITLAIVVVLAIVVLSYRQVIRAYPHRGRQLRRRPREPRTGRRHDRRCRPPD